MDKGLRRFYLNLDLAREAVTSEERTEALAFALLVKLTFVDSKVHDATYRNMKTLFNMGSSRLQRVVKNAIRYGYLVREGKTLRALSIRGDVGAYKRQLHFENHSYSVEDRTPYKLSNLMKEIRKSVILNHIKKTEDTANTFRKANSPKNKAEYVSAKKKLSRMSMDVTSYNDKISYAAFMHLTSTTRYMSRKLVRDLANEDRISRVFNFTPTDDDRNFEQEAFYSIFNGKFISGNFEVTKNIHGVICVQEANSYSYISDDIHYYVPKKF